MADRLRFATWNVRGFRDKTKQTAVISLAKLHDIDLLFVQEANFRSLLDVTLFRNLCQVDAFFSLTRAKSCGVGVVFVSGRFRQKAHCVFGADGRTLILDIFIDGRKVRLVNVYAPTTRTETNTFFRELGESLQAPLPHVVLGDFNCVVDTTRDIRGPGRGGSAYHAKDLVRLLRRLRLSDAWVLQHDNAFGPTRMSRTTASRLDRAYLPDLLLPSLEACEVLPLPPALAGISDHVPLVTTVRGKPGPSPANASWRLDPALLNDPVSTPLMQQRIEATIRATPRVTPAVWDDLKATWKAHLQQEGRARKKRITAQMNELLRRMRIVQNAECLTSCTRDYLAALKVQHARLQRAITGEKGAFRTTSEGHREEDLREVSGNGSVRILQVRRPDGTLTEDPAEIEATFRRHFETAFREPEPITTSSELPHRSELYQFLKHLDEGECPTLCGAATMQELWAAIQSMPPNSAPGADGLTAGFYATFFSILSEPLLGVINSILEGHAKPASFAMGRVVLILKEGSPPNDPTSWRPITLLNADYKIVASILNSRLKTFLPDIIAPHQTCAVPGRSLFANLNMTRDAFQYATEKRVSGAFLSLDQAKAFDRVRHAYLFETLREFGLPAGFVNIIKLLYSDLRCHVVVNGSTTDTFQYTRGIRQGCPLGPTLFVLSIEPLLTSVAGDTRIRGLPLTGTAELKILGYADDISLFVRDASSLDRFRQLFAFYAAASGAQLNEEKCRALRFGNFPAHAIGTFQAVNTVKVLGIYFSSEGVAPSTWSRVLERAAQMAERAGLRDLSLREKALAVKTSICALALYASRVAVMPARTINQLSKLITAYLWEGKPPPLKRHLLHLAVSEGGLGLPHVQSAGRILALKTARALARASDYVGHNLLLYWSGARHDWLDAGRHTGPFAEAPAPYYKTAAATMRMLGNELPGCDVDEDPPARIVEAITMNQLSDADRKRAKRAQSELGSLRCGIPREAHDLLLKKAWHVLPTRQRLNKLGIVPNASCPNCRVVETQEHALFECVAVKPVWRMVAHSFGIRTPPNHKRNKGAFAQLVVIFTVLVLWQRRSLAEARRKPVRAAFPAVSRIRRLLWAYLSAELEASGEEKFLRRWHTKFFFLRDGKLAAPITPF